MHSFLLLLAGESGKSTIVKQMRLIYRAPYSDADRDSFREVVFANTLQSMQAVLRGFDVTKIALPDALYPDADYVLAMQADKLGAQAGVLDQGVADAIRKLWSEDSTKRCVALSSMYQLNDSGQCLACWDGHSSGRCRR